MHFPSWSQKRGLSRTRACLWGCLCGGDRHLGWFCDAVSERVRAAGFWEFNGNQPRWLETFHFCNKILGIWYTTASSHLPYCKNIPPLEIIHHLQRNVTLGESSSRGILWCRVWCRQTLLERHSQPKLPCPWVLNRYPSWRSNLLLTPKVQQAEAWIASALSASELQAERNFRLPGAMFWSADWAQGADIRDLTASGQVVMCSEHQRCLLAS